MQRVLLPKRDIDGDNQREGYRMHARSRIGTFGLFGGGNLGNDGSLEAVLVSLRRLVPDAEIGCICAKPSVVESTHGVTAVPIRTPTPVAIRSRRFIVLAWKAMREFFDWPATFFRVRKFDVILVPGTGILDDFGDRPWGMPLTILRFCLMARLAGTKVWLVSVGAGPIRHPLSRRLMLWAARLAQYRSYRDLHSRDYMAALGLATERDGVYPDVAFGLRTPDARSMSDAGPDGRGRDVPTIGVGIMAYYGWKRRSDGTSIHDAYIEHMTCFVLWLIEQGYRVRLIMGETSDEASIAELRQAVSARMPDLSQDRLVSTPAHSLSDVMLQMAECQVVIASRFHNVICALRLGKPTISLGYADKFDVLMVDMGLADFRQHVERLDVELLKRQLDQALTDRAQLSSSICARMLDYQAQLRQQETLLGDMLQHV